MRILLFMLLGIFMYQETLYAEGKFIRHPIEKPKQVDMKTAYDDSLPISTPVEFADTIKDLIKDKVVCDIGAGNGRFLNACRKYASKIIAVEKDPMMIRIEKEYYNIDGIQGDIFKIEVPKADVYYLYDPGWNEHIPLQKFVDRIPSGTIICGNHPYEPDSELKRAYTQVPELKWEYTVIQK